MDANFFPLQEQNVINAGPAFPHGVSPDLFSGYGWWKEDGTCEHYTDDYAFVRFGLTGLELA